MVTMQLLKNRGGLGGFYNKCDAGHAKKIAGKV